MLIFGMTVLKKKEKKLPKGSFDFTSFSLQKMLEALIPHYPHFGAHFPCLFNVLKCLARKHKMKIAQIKTPDKMIFFFFVLADRSTWASKGNRAGKLSTHSLHLIRWELRQFLEPLQILLSDKILRMHSTTKTAPKQMFTGDLMVSVRHYAISGWEILHLHCTKKNGFVFYDLLFIHPFKSFLEEHKGTTFSIC